MARRNRSLRARRERQCRELWMIRVLSIANLIGDAIGRTAAEESVSTLFD